VHRTASVAVVKTTMQIELRVTADFDAVPQNGIDHLEETCVHWRR
jgi:hypothetical protein